MDKLLVKTPIRGAHPSDWTLEEQQAARSLYPEAPAEEVLAALPNRTWVAIQGWCIKNAVRRVRSPRHGVWTAQELATLDAKYPLLGAIGLQPELSAHSHQAIRQRAHHRGLVAPKCCRLPSNKAAKERGAKLSASAEKRLKARRKAALKAERLAADRRAARLQRLLAPKPKAVKPPKPAKVLLEKPEAKALPMPGVQSNFSTPVLNAQKAARIAAQKLEQQQKVKQAIVPAADLAKLPYTHPARMAYMLNAKHGGHAASQAFHQVMNTLKAA